MSAAHADTKMTNVGTDFHSVVFTKGNSSEKFSVHFQAVAHVFCTFLRNAFNEPRIAISYAKFIANI